MNVTKKTKRGILVLLVGAVILAIGVSTLCTKLATKEQKQNSHSKLELIDSLIQDSKASETEITENYDQQYQAKADSVAFLAKNSDDFTYSDEQMDELRDVLNVDYIAIQNASGTVLAKSGKVPSKDKESHTYTAKIDSGHKVRIVHNTDTLDANLAVNASLSYVLDDVHVGQNGFAFAVHSVKKTILFYPDDSLIGDQAADHGIDISKMKDGSDLDITIDGTKYFCSVHQVDKGLIAVAVPYSEIRANRTMTIAIALVIYFILAGMIILYCTFLAQEHAKADADSANSANNATGAIGTAATDKTASNADERQIGGHTGAGSTGTSGMNASRRRYNRALGNKVLCIAIIGSLLSFGVTYYTQTLLTLSQQSITSNARGTEMLDTLSRNSSTVQTETTEYQKQCLEKVELGAYIIQHTDKDDLTQKYMISLRNALQVSNLSLFNTKGKIQASDSNLWSFSLSKDKDDQTYEFWSILDGTKDEIVQDIQTDDEGNPKQYIGKAIVDDNHQTVGMLEIGVTPDALEKATLNTDLATVLQGIQIGKGGFAFAVDTKDNTFAYFPKKKLMDQSVTDYGMTESMLVADYNDFITIDGTRYYCASGKFSHYITYVAVPFRSMNQAALPVSILATAVMFVFLLLLWWLFSFTRDSEAETPYPSPLKTASAPAGTFDPAGRNGLAASTGSAGAQNTGMAHGAAEEYQAGITSVSGQSHRPVPAGKSGTTESSKGSDAAKTGSNIVNVDLGGGRTGRSRAATARWSHRGIAWEDMTAGQKTFFLVNHVLMVLAFVVLIAVVFANNIFADDSLIRFILRGKWQHGINLFSITYCILIGISIIELTIILRKIVMWIAGFLNARGETICRMLDNFLKTFSFLFILYYCLSILGVDTHTLLASAGILSLVIGLGAQSLVADILAGLFIIFESEFQVGDIVTIDGFRGTVVEIGVRTTKVKEGSGNVKIFSNSSVKNILNMTKDYSIISVDMVVKYSEDLHYIEKVLRDEFPKIKRNLPTIVEGPFYRGVSAQNMDTMTIRIIAKCLEHDRVQLDRDLRRQMKLVFDDYDINIPSSEIGAIRPAATPAELPDEQDDDSGKAGGKDGKKDKEKGKDKSKEKGKDKGKDKDKDRIKGKNKSKQLDSERLKRLQERQADNFVKQQTEEFQKTDITED
jgi:moderate conductance mechanosensitive channel